MTTTIHRHKKTGALVRVERRDGMIHLTHADGRKEAVDPRFWADHQSTSYRWIDRRTR